MKFFAITANRSEPDGMDMAIHADTCASRERRTRPDGYSFEAVDVDAALAEVIDDEMQEMGWETSDVHVFPCTTGKVDA